LQDERFAETRDGPGKKLTTSSHGGPTGAWLPSVTREQRRESQAEGCSYLAS